MESYAALLPPGLHTMTYAALLALCVTPFPDDSTRREIARSVLFIIDRLALNGVTGEAWIDGSFLTDKPDPGDADIVFFAPREQYNHGTARQQDALAWVGENLRGSFPCDTYVVLVTPPDSPLYALYQSQRDYWLDFFGSDKQGVPKGIAVLKIGA